MKRRVLRSVLTMIPLAIATTSTPARGLARETPLPSAEVGQKQGAVPPTTIGETTVEVVQVDAVVTDSKGRYVTDLEASDFEIFEDGRKQTISNCTYITPELETRSQATTGSASSLPPRQSVRRTMALVVDDLGLDLWSVSRVRTALHTFLDSQMRPGDLVAIVRTSAGMGALQQFTGDKRMLHAAVESIRYQLWGRASPAFAVTGVDGGGPPRSFGGGPSGEAMAAFDGRVRAMDARREVRRQEYLTTGTLGAVRFVLNGMVRMPGRKSIVLVSEGFAMVDESESRKSLSDGVRALSDLANRASVVIYSFDPSGLSATVTSAMADARRAGLTRLASDTGGLLLADTNDLTGAIGRVLDDQRGYYLIGYSPEPSSPGRKREASYHRVRVAALRRDLRVRSRRGFYPVSAAEERIEPADPLERLAEAAQSPFSAPDLPLRLTTIFERDEKGGSLVRSVVHIDARKLTFTERPDGARAAELLLLTMMFAGDGRVVARSGREERIAVRAEAFEAALDGGLVYSLETPVAEPGGYQARVAVMDSASGRLGSASRFVEVPEIAKGQLVLSGLAMSGGGSEDVADPRTTPAVRRFQPGSMVAYALFAYNAGGPLEVRPTVYRDTVPVYQPAALPFDASGQPDPNRLAIVGRVHLGSELQPGPYTLEVAVAEAGGRGKGRGARQWIEFEIEAP
jgi:VWFA-related protein